eukprot:5283127-Pyramimonas_sp.AAC.1
MLAHGGRKRGANKASDVLPYMTDEGAEAPTDGPPSSTARSTNTGRGRPTHAESFQSSRDGSS